VRTRRSWRNQNRLFKELFAPAPQPVADVPILTDAEIDAMYWLPKTSRNLMKRDAAKRRQSRPTDIRRRIE
jgi:hypothetical protein